MDRIFPSDNRYRIFSQTIYPLLVEQRPKLETLYCAVLQGLEKAGRVPKRGKQRLDSTHVLGLVKKMSALERVREALRLAWLELGQHHEALQARRQEMKTAEFELKKRRRNAIEGTQSELVRGHGMRRARYRGLLKVRLQNYLIGAACNVKRRFRVTKAEMKMAEGGALQMT